MTYNDAKIELSLALAELQSAKHTYQVATARYTSAIELCRSLKQNDHQTNTTLKIWHKQKKELLDYYTKYLKSIGLRGTRGFYPGYNERVQEELDKIEAIKPGDRLPEPLTISQINSKDI